MTTINRSDEEPTGSRVHQESGSFAANARSAAGRVRTAPIRDVLDHVPYASRKAMAAKGAIGKKVRAATGDKAPVAVKALVEAAPGGKSSPQAGVLKAMAVMARDRKAVARATRLPEAGWPVLTVAAVHRVISEAMPESRKMSASI